MMTDSLNRLRQTIEHNASLISDLFRAHEAQGVNAVYELLVELDNNNADLMVVLEELQSHPPLPEDGVAE
jgi:hypothetical protein